MPYLDGCSVTGILLTVLAVFVIDHVKTASETSANEPQKIVNWDVAEQRLRSSLGTLKEKFTRRHVKANGLVRTLPGGLVGPSSVCLSWSSRALSRSASL